MRYDPNLTVSYLAGTVDKLVKNQGRDTIKRNAANDPNARYARIPNGDACDFCKMLGSRGFVYHTEATAGGDDPYHRMCNCQIAVSFEPFIERYWVGGVHVSRGHADDAQVAVPGRDGSSELRDVDIDELFEEYKQAGNRYAKRSVYKDYSTMPDFMKDPLGYLRSAETEDELRKRADEVLKAYKDNFTDKQLEKILPSARSIAQKRLGELKSEGINELRIDQQVVVSPYNVPSDSGYANDYGFDVPFREYSKMREIDQSRIVTSKHANPDEWEIATAEILDSLGFSVKFNARSLKMNDRRADVTIDGKHWEIKNPSGAGYLCLHNQIRSNLYGEDKHHLNPQSEFVIVSNVRSSLTLDDMEEQLCRVMTGESGLSTKELACIQRVMLVDRNGTARVFDYRNR